MKTNRSAADRTVVLPHTDVAPQPARMTPIVAIDGGSVHRACFRYADQSNAETHLTVNGYSELCSDLCGRSGKVDALECPGKVCLDCVSVASSRRLTVR